MPRAYFCPRENAAGGRVHVRARRTRPRLLTGAAERCGYHTDDAKMRAWTQTGICTRRERQRYSFTTVIPKAPIRLNQHSWLGGAHVCGKPIYGFPNLNGHHPTVWLALAKL